MKRQLLHKHMYIMKRKTGVKSVSIKASFPQIRRTRVPNMGRWIICKESTKNSYKIWKIYKYKGYKLRTKQCLSLTRLTNKIFLHTKTKCILSISCYRASYNDKWEHQLDATIKYIFHLKLVSTLQGLLPYAGMHSCVISWWWAMSRPKHVETNFKWNIYLIVASSWCSHLSKCIRPSEMFRTSYPLFYTVVFRETTSTEHTISVLFLFFCRIVSQRNS